MCDDVMCIVMCICRLKASETGDYSFCFDNSFSQFSKKTVFFELYIASPDDDDDDDDTTRFPNLPDDTDYDFKLEDFKVMTTYVRNAGAGPVNNSP